MFKKFASFWMENTQLTRLMIGSIFALGIFSWLIIPKQYNPDIVVPAFQITVPTAGMKSEQTYTLVTRPLENIVAGLEGVEHVYGYSANNIASVLVSFQVGTDKEDATTRIYNALMGNQGIFPLGINERNIVSIDPDDIPIFSFAVTKGSQKKALMKSDEAGATDNIDQTSSSSLDLIKLRKISLDIIEKLKTVKNTTLRYYQGGQAKQVIVDLDLDALAAKQVDVIQVLQVLQKQQVNFPVGSLKLGDTEAILTVEASQDTLDQVKQIVVASYQGKQIYLEDVADIYRGLNDFVPLAYFGSSQDLQDTVFIGVAKKKGSNAVHVTKTLQKEIKNIVSQLPQGFSLEIIQDEGSTASETTNMLLINLVQSILIVLIVLSIFLGRTKALNVAITIPLTLSIVFLFILLIGDNINRITLFALILVLGMLVDDATVVVENVSRHLHLRQKTMKTKKEAIFDAISEVELGVVLSTITRLLAFVAMFFVTGMMGDYMGPIPKYAIVTMIASTIIALSVNPFLAYVFEPNIEKDLKDSDDDLIDSHLYTENCIQKNISGYVGNDSLLSCKARSSCTGVFYNILSLLKKWRNVLSLRFEKKWYNFGKRYQSWMKVYLDPKEKKKRKRFKVIFWIVLGIVVVLPIYVGIFKARMLPKSDQQQIYLWLDLPRDANIETSKKVMKGVEEFLRQYYVHEDGELSIENGENKIAKDANIQKAQKNSDIINTLPSTPSFREVDSSLGEGENPRIIKNTSRWVGMSPMLDFSNLFRGSQSRVMPYQISVRINLTHPSQREITSEQFVITLRPVLRKFLDDHFPSVEMRLLEDPPGPPVRATFLLELSSDEIPYDVLLQESKRLQKKLAGVMKAYDVVDMGVSDDGWQTKYIINLDHQFISQAGLTAEQIGATLGTLYHGMDVALLYDNNSLEPITIHIRGKDTQINNLDSFSQVLITNPQGKRIPLSELAKIIPTENEQAIYSDERIPTVYIYGEMGNNSVVYPVLGLYKIFGKQDFREGKYEYLGGDPYGFDLKHKLTGQKLRINIGGEWELTMDTFRDMGTAMILAFLAIYIMMVIQFGSFGIGGVIMISFLLGFFGVFPGYALLYLIQGEYFSATSMIGVIALAGIVVGNAILLIEYVMILLKRGNTVRMSLLVAGRTRMKAILITSLTTVLGATTILGDPVWSGVAWAIILGLSTSAILTTIVLPIFLHDGLLESREKYIKKIQQ